MREIEFRIKDCKGKWHYGYPVFFDDGSFSFFVNEKLNDELLPYEECSVECAVNNTLGQYTGLCDKNGTKIFEGDIISCVTEDTNETRFAVIKYGKYKDENFEDSCLGFYIEFKGEQYSMFNGEAGGYDLLSRVEVVDNVHDNSKLLEG